MGCDIHAHFEIKLNNKWEHYSQPRILRNYRLFALIAGVRNFDNKITPIVKPKGLPKNLSVTTQLDVNRGKQDWHTYTWLDTDEIVLLLNTDFVKEDWKFEFTQLGFLFGNGWGDWKDYPDSYPTEIEDIRFICWFDN